MTIDWEPYLDPDEAMIWEGHPRKGIRPWPGLLLSALGLPFLAISAFVLFHGGRLKEPFADIGEAMISIVFAIAGLYLLVGIWFKEASRHRRIRYAFSDRRAYIAEGKEVHVVVIRGHAVEPTGIEDGSGTVLFGPRDSGGNSKDRASFDDIDNAEHVAALMREVSERD